LDQVPLVDFCNQNTPRAQPQDRPIPVRARRRSAPSLRRAGREPPNGFDAIRRANHRIRVMPSDVPASSSLAVRPGQRRVEPRSHPTRRSAPAEVSRVRGRPAFAARRLPSGAHAYATHGALDALESISATGASPQPDPLGHLLSRDRGAPGGEPGAVRRPLPSRRSEMKRYASDDPAARTPALASERESVGPTWPRTTRLRGVGEAKGRFIRASAKRSEIGCARGAFRRRATRTRETWLSPWFRASGGAFSTDCHQPVENAWRRCHCWPANALTRLP